jgi:hypothetical protein
MSGEEGVTVRKALNLKADSKGWSFVRPGEGLSSTFLNSTLFCLIFFIGPFFSLLRSELMSLSHIMGFLLYSNQIPSHLIETCFLPDRTPFLL